ncbi:MAG TPA: hypothetical protein VF222_03290 [Nitrososphaeraceae archaeon]
MTLKYFLIGLISISIFFATASTVSPAAFAQNLTIFSLFVNETGGISGTEHILEGTNEELTNQYYKLGEEFDKKTGIKPGDPVTFVFKNNSAVTIPYPGKYKNVVAEDFLREVIPLGGDRDFICWYYSSTQQTHWVCGHW